MPGQDDASSVLSNPISDTTLDAVWEKVPNIAGNQDVVATPLVDDGYLYGFKLYMILLGLSLAVFLVALDNAIISTVSDSTAQFLDPNLTTT
jgi:hypothetical protein